MYIDLSELPVVSGNEPSPLLSRVNEFKHEQAQSIRDSIVRHMSEFIVKDKLSHTYWFDSTDHRFSDFKSTTEPVRQLAIGYLDQYGIDTEKIVKKIGWWIFSRKQVGYRFSVRGDASDVEPARKINQFPKVKELLEKAKDIDPSWEDGVFRIWSWKDTRKEILSMIAMIETQAKIIEDV